MIGWALGVVPGVFALPAGIGDVTTGLLAVPVAISLAAGTLEARRAAVAWNIFGLLDFTIAVSIGLMISARAIATDRTKHSQHGRRALSECDDPGLRGTELDPAARTVLAPAAPPLPLTEDTDMGHSMREILAAWACGGLVVLAALLVESRGAPTVAVYAGVRIPGQVGQTEPNLSIADEFADARDDAGTVSDSAEPPLYPKQEVAESQSCWLRSFVHRLL